jgi:hypothetical protein
MRFAAACFLTATSASAEPPLCRASLILEPSEAFVGQPVLHRVQIERRRDVVDLRWETNPSFPAFRAEWIPSRTSPGPSEGTTLLEERRVLFAGRAGSLALPRAQLICESADRLERVPLPATELVAREPPEAGRPSDWQGLIGPVDVSLRVTPDRVALGESASVSVIVTGETNVWAAPMPLSGAFGDGAAELFDRPAELARDSGLRLVLRRYFGFDLVPRRVGTLAIPEIRIPYFDPETGRYEAARAAALEIAVTPAVKEREHLETAAPAATPAPAGGTEPGMPWWSWLAGAGVLAGALWGWRHLSASGEAAPRDSLARLREALAAGEPEPAAASAARALREALEAALPGAKAREWEALLGRLDAARFGGAEPELLLALAREAELRLSGR